MAVTYTNIGVVFRKQAKCTEAICMYKKALAIDEKTYGCNHPHIAANFMK